MPEFTITYPHLNLDGRLYCTHQVRNRYNFSMAVNGYLDHITNPWQKRPVDLLVPANVSGFGIS